MLQRHLSNVKSQEEDSSERRIEGYKKNILIPK